MASSRKKPHWPCFKSIAWVYHGRTLSAYLKLSRDFLSITGFARTYIPCSSRFPKIPLPHLVTPYKTKDVVLWRDISQNNTSFWPKGLSAQLFLGAGQGESDLGSFEGRRRSHEEEKIVWFRAHIFDSTVLPALRYASLGGHTKAGWTMRTTRWSMRRHLTQRSSENASRRKFFSGESIQRSHKILGRYKKLRESACHLCVDGNCSWSFEHHRPLKS